MNAPTPEQMRALADDRKALEVAIGYEPVPLSIRDHPEIRFEYRTAADRDGLVERILAAGFTQRAIAHAEEDDADPEEFCDRCYAGVDSDEHHEKCVVIGIAEDGESASGGVTCGACGADVWMRADRWWVDRRGRAGFRVLDAWHQHKPLYAALPADAPEDEL